MRIALALALVVPALVAMPLAAPAQQTPKIPRIGLLSVGTDPSRPLPPQWLAFLDGLRVLGYVEGQNIVIERRFAAGKSERVAGMATELVQLGVDVIVATGLRENQAARQATTRTPIVMIMVDDPVEAGLAKSLARPGGNFTGLSFTAPGEKYVELLGQAVPSARRMAIVGSRRQPPGFLKEIHGAARTMNIALPSPILVRGPRSSKPPSPRRAPTASGGSSSPPMLLASSIASGWWTSRQNTASPPSTRTVSSLTRAGSWLTAPALSSASAGRPRSWTRSSRARSRLICPSSSRRSSS